LRNAVLAPHLLPSRLARVIGVLEFGAVFHDSTHHWDRVFLGGEDIAALDRTRVSVARNADADGNVGTKTPAGIADFGVPSEEIGCSEVVETINDSVAVLICIDAVGRNAWFVSFE
jgi:hypothetical protein